uniref:YTH domain-containing family protein n=1 Tax=Anthurium amnicola TaxID=1678845 RepID=A0A1D1XI96_9ARAE
MAAVAPAADQATDLLQKLSLDSQTKTKGASEATKKPYESANGVNVSSAPVPSSERSTPPLLQDFMEPSVCYLPNYATPAYYYGAYDGSVNEWEEYSRYVNLEEMPPAGVYGDIYHHGYGYAPYGAYAPPASPVPTMGHDGQLYSPQHYQYPSPYYPPPTPTSSAFTPSNQLPLPPGDVSTSVTSEQPTAPVDATKANSNGVSNGSSNVNNGTTPQRPTPENPSISSNGSYGRDAQHRLATTSSISSPVFHVGNNSSTRNQNLRPFPHPMGLHTHRPTSGMGPTAPGLMSGLYPTTRMYGQCGNAYRTGLGFASNGYDSRTNGRGWLALDPKYKPRGRGNGFYGYGNENSDGIGELNRGPRSCRFKSQKGIGPNVTIAVKGQDLPSGGNIEDSSIVPDKDQYNKEDFPEKYSDAKFFVIKSYSEDDVHKSVKYNVWASTASGNKKLDAAYQESKEKAGGCPVFLFFSVNTSGQFVGMAEMVGPVDFNKTVDYWQQSKWTGCFPVKWHMVKDVPNSMLKHITLENNDNKPVTNSRDTQEVRLEQGLQMLKLFKEHVSKTSILDDFLFYEARQKTMQERRAKQQQFQKQVWDGKATDVAVAEERDDIAKNGKPRMQKPSELAVLNKEPVQGALGERKQSEDNVVSTVVGETQKVAKLATEKRVVANGVANRC